MKLRQQWILAGVATLVLTASAIVCRAALLDGTRWQITISPDPAAADKGQKGFADQLTFAGEKFSSEFFLAKGFKPASYHSEIEPNEAEFEVEQASESEGVLTWLGEIRGTTITGRLVWRKDDGTKLAFEFSGAKR